MFSAGCVGNLSLSFFITNILELFSCKIWFSELFSPHVIIHPTKKNNSWSWYLGNILTLGLSILHECIFFCIRFYLCTYVHDTNTMWDRVRCTLYIVNAVLMSVQSIKSSIQENLQVMSETQDDCCLYRKGR